MFRISGNQNTVFLENTNIKYMKFEKNFYDCFVEILDDSLVMKKDEFQNLIKTDALKNLKLICKMPEFTNKEVNLLLNLGFDFLGVDYNPETQETEEVYVYKYKEEIYVKDHELKDILEKLEID